MKGQILTVLSRTVVDAIRALLGKGRLLGPSLALSQGSCVAENRCGVFDVIIRGFAVFIRFGLASLSGLEGSVEAIQWSERHGGEDVVDCCKDVKVVERLI